VNVKWVEKWEKEVKNNDNEMVFNRLLNVGSVIIGNVKVLKWLFIRL
jgi:hypothetical protein